MKHILPILMIASCMLVSCLFVQQDDCVVTYLDEHFDEKIEMADKGGAAEFKTLAKCNASRVVKIWMVRHSDPRTQLSFSYNRDTKVWEMDTHREYSITVSQDARQIAIPNNPWNDDCSVFIKMLIDGGHKTFRIIQEGRSVTE